MRDGLVDPNDKIEDSFKVWRHLISQGQKKIIGNTCVYKNALMFLIELWNRPFPPNSEPYPQVKRSMLCHKYQSLKSVSKVIFAKGEHDGYDRCNGGRWTEWGNFPLDLLDQTLWLFFNVTKDIIRFPSIHPSNPSTYSFRCDIRLRRRY